MDKENLNGIPEEEIEVVNENAAEEIAAEETAEISEEIAEETVAEDISETEETEEITEDTADDAQENEIPEIGEEMAEEDNLCPMCGENECEEDSSYCLECETKMLKRKIPLSAWLAGLFSLGFSFFAFIVVILASAPALQVVKGDEYAKNKNWYAAYTEYNKVSDVSAQINEILQKESVYTTVGTGVSKRIIESVANYSSPMDAYYVAQNLFSTDTPETSHGFMKKYAKIYKEHNSSYSAMSDILDKVFGENPDKDAIFAELDALKGKEGVKDVYLAFYKFAIASELGVDYNGQVEYLKELEKVCKATGDDYGWLYELPMAETLILAGKEEDAVKYLDSMIKKDCSKYDAYKLKMTIQLDNGDKDGASKTLAEFKVNNEGKDTAYLLEIYLLRRNGENEKAKTLAVDALEEYGSEPEINRQLALTLMVKGDYVNAFDYIMAAYNSAYYQYYYTGDSSTLNNPQFYSTLYLSAYVLKNSDQMKEDFSKDVEDVLEQFEIGVLTDDTKAIVNGEKTVSQILTEGDCDL